MQMSPRLFILLALSALWCGGVAVAERFLPLKKPIILGGDRTLDACSSTGVVIDLDPAKSGFLSVRAGPGLQFAELDRILSRQELWLCRESGPWYGVVYGKDAGEQCGVSTSWPVRKPYAGPCRAGWVHSRYVRLRAG